MRLLGLGQAVPRPQASTGRGGRGPAKTADLKPILDLHKPGLSAEDSLAYTGAEMSQVIGISLIGCGTVGEQVVRILLDADGSLASRTGLQFEIRHVVVRDPGKKRGVTIPTAKISADTSALLADPQSEIVVELMGGADEAKRVTRAALAAGKSVVTANKALLAMHGREVFSAARRANQCVAFEASVAGGIPLIESVRRGLIGNRIDAVYGILNGTCNYILTRMLNNSASYAHALAEAQRLGYAEADPTLDVEGIDTAHKLSILASIAMRQSCELDRIAVAGISDIELLDLTSGRELGYACKLLAIARRTGDGIDLSVKPTFVRHAHPLASVSGPFNAISFYGDAVGHVMLYGRGAGGAPTASAVVSDIVDVALGNPRRTFDQLTVLPDQTPLAVYSSPGENVAAYYLRVSLRDRPGSVGKVATVLGAEGISIASLIQHEPAVGLINGSVPVIITTRPARQAAMSQALDAMTSLEAVACRPICIPLLEESGDQVL